MWIQAAHDDLRIGDAEPVAQVGMQDAQYALEPFRRNRLGNLAQRQMRCCQSNAQVAGDEHHDGECRAGNVGKKLGMS